MCVFVFVCVYVIPNQSISQKPYYMLDLSKCDALLHKAQGLSGTKVPRLKICRSILSLSKIGYEMWHDHPLSQRNRATKRTGWGEGVGGWRCQRSGGEAVIGQILKKKELRNIC